jgi:ribosomal protein S18 acetylase RimI-like enzyme
MRIRAARPSDIPEMRRVMRSAGMLGYPRSYDSPQRIRAVVKRNRQYCLVAEDRGRIVGCVLGTTDGGRLGYMWRLSVDPGCRRRGIATALVRECQKRLFRNVLSVCANIWQGNKPSEKLFKKLGYKRLGLQVYEKWLR